MANISICNVFLPWLDIEDNIEATLESEDGPLFLDFKDMGYNMVNILSYLFYVCIHIHMHIFPGNSILPSFLYCNLAQNYTSHISH